MARPTNQTGRCTASNRGEQMKISHHGRGSGIPLTLRLSSLIATARPATLSFSAAARDGVTETDRSCADSGLHDVDEVTDDAIFIEAVDLLQPGLDFAHDDRLRSSR